MKPFAEAQFEGFIYPMMEQIACHAARMRHRTRGRMSCPAVFRAPWGGGIRAPEHHSEANEHLFTNIPGLRVVLPSSPGRAYGMLLAAIRDPDPVIFFEHKATYRAVKGDVPDGDFTIPLGPADVKRAGTDITVYAYGLMLHRCLEAAEKLAAEGISVNVVDVRSLRPLDSDTILEEARKTGKCLVVYEDNRLFGAGAEICAMIAEEAFDSLDAPVMRLAGPESPATPFNKVQEDAFLPNADNIAMKMRELASY